MAGQTQIEWSEMVWNLVTGCTRVSPGCLHCYAERMSCRLAGFARRHPEIHDRRSCYIGVINDHGRWNNRIRLIPEALNDPLAWRQPRLVFVCSMSDLFHEDVPDGFIQRVFGVMNLCPQHTFQVLTKRSERLLELSPQLPWADNIWMGVSVEREDYTFRIDHLRATAARTRFLSLEPLLGPLPDLNLAGIHWAIVGGESGPGARPMAEAWVLDIREQCHKAGVAFFFKQWGGMNKKQAGRVLEGRTWDAMPLPVADRTRLEVLNTACAGCPSAIEGLEPPATPPPGGARR